MVKEVSESCVESLLAEIVLSYCSGFYANMPELAVRRIEAVGFQVGVPVYTAGTDVKPAEIERQGKTEARNKNVCRKYTPSGY